ncbi:MAG: hypothetical protein EKK29_14835 [Hyphomicrobiales bacterium]|nr:MAG: hypothetical protein EKK29_14835 [Hyphomicrobiales bacterium]
MIDLIRQPNSGQDIVAARVRRMLTSYLFNCPRGPASVREMICEDIQRFTELGARRYVADLVEVLKQYDSACSKC